jgi:hypothetical protein
LRISFVYRLFIVCLSFVFSGLLMAALALPLLRGSIGRNAWYGIRTPASMASDEAWYAINRQGARPLIFCGLATVVLSMSAYPLIDAFGPDIGSLAATGIAILPMLFACLWILWQVAAYKNDHDGLEQS